MHSEHLFIHSGKTVTIDTSPVTPLQTHVMKPGASKRVTTHSTGAKRDKTLDSGVYLCCVCVCVPACLCMHYAIHSCTFRTFICLYSELADDTSPVIPLQSRVMKPGASKRMTTRSIGAERDKILDSGVHLCVCLHAYVCSMQYTPLHLEHLSVHSELADDTSPVKPLQSRVMKPGASKRVTTHSKRVERDRIRNSGVCVCVHMCLVHAFLSI